MYAFVDVEQYQIVGTGQTIDEAKSNYRKALNLEDVEVQELVDSTEISGTVASLASAVVSGNTCYYFTLEGDSQVYTASVDIHEKLPFMQPGAELSFSYAEDGAVRRVTEVHELALPDSGTFPARRKLPKQIPSSLRLQKKSLRLILRPDSRQTDSRRKLSHEI